MAAEKNRQVPRWVRLRITRAGWLFSAVSVLVGVAAGQSQATLAFVVFGVMLGALLVSGLLARWMLLAVSVRRDMPERVWQNKTVYLAYSLRNERNRGVCLGLSVNEIAPVGIDSAGGYCLQLPPRGVFRAGSRFAAARRGRIDFWAVSLSTSFPFGLVNGSRAIRAPGAIVVWPAIGKLKCRLLDHGAVQTSSAAPSRAMGGQDEFFGLREYREGDNPRWIHWRRSATRRIPVVREMARPLPEVLWLVVDAYWPDRLPPADARREKLLRFAATLIEYSLSRGYMVGMAIAGRDGVKLLRPADDRGQRSALLDALADVDEQTRTTLDDVLGALQRGMMRNAQVIVIAPDSPRLAAAPIAAVRAECSALTIITDRQLPEVFEDNPIAAGRAERSALTIITDRQLPEVFEDNPIAAGRAERSASDGNHRQAIAEGRG